MEYSFRSLCIADIIDAARQKDELFIAKYARTMNDGTTVRRFKIIPHEDPQLVGKKFRIVHNEETNSNIGPAIKNTAVSSDRHKGKGREEDSRVRRHSSKTAKQNEENANVKDDHGRKEQAQEVAAENEETKEEPPKLLECTIYGELQFLESAGPYGNWVPKATDNPDDIMFPAEDINRAAVVITVNISPIIVDSFKVIDDAMVAHLEEMGVQVEKYNEAVRKDLVSLKYPLVVPLEEWRENNTKGICLVFV
jgi:hypothetical protein